MSKAIDDFCMLSPKMLDMDLDSFIENLEYYKRSIINDFELVHNMRIVIRSDEDHLGVQSRLEIHFKRKSKGED